MKTIPRASDIDSVVKTHKTISKISIIALVVVSILYAVLYYLKDKETDKRAYFVFPNTVYEGEAQSTGLINYYIAKDHLRKFIGLMFSHDKDSFKPRIEAALNLIDKEEGKALYFQFKQGKVLETYQTYGSRTRVEIDSIKLDMKKIPIEGAAYFRQFYIVPDAPEFVQPIAFKFNLESTNFQSEVNSAGLLINKFEMIPYSIQSDENTPRSNSEQPAQNTEEVTP